jgi:MFS family permease
MLRDPRFWAALPASLLPAFWATGIFLYQTALADASGWSPSLMASAFSAFALTRIASSLVGGSMVDRFSARRIFPFSTLPLGVGLVVLLAFEGAWVPFAFMAALGVTTGFSGNARVALFAELYGVRHLGALKSLMGALLAASTAASPVLVGVILDSGAGMDRMLVGAVASVVVGAVASVAVLGHREPRG